MIKNCLARIGCLTLLLLGGAGAWLWRDQIRAEWHDLWPAVSAPAQRGPSEAAARRAERKFADFLRAKPGSELRLSEVEVQSWLAYRAGPRLPRGVSDPSITLGDSTATLEGFVRVQELPGSRNLGPLARVLGDSARVEVTVLPEVRRPGTLSLEVEGAKANGLPVPPLMLPFALRGLGLPTDASGRAVRVPLPPQVAAARVEQTQLVLERGTASATKGP